MSSPISNDLIISLLESYLAIRPDQVVILRTQWGDFAQAFWVRSDQGDFVLRIAPPDEEKVLFYEEGMMCREVALLDTLRDQTTIPIPEIVAYDFERRLIDRDFLIMKEMPGVAYSEIKSLSHAQHDRVYTQLGTYLKQLHGIIGGGYGYDGLQGPQPTWRQTFEAMWHKLVNDVVACGVYSGAEAESLITLLETYDTYFEREPPPALLHMGMNKENIMVDAQGNVTGLLGFDTALWGDPEIDFAVLDCSGIWGSSFWEGYGQPRPNDLGSRTRRKFYILYEVQKNIPLAIKRYNDLEEADQYKQTTITIATNLASLEP